MAAVRIDNVLTDSMENGFGQDKGEQSGNVVAWVGGKLATSPVGVRWESPGVLTSIQHAGCDFPSQGLEQARDWTGRSIGMGGAKGVVVREQ